LVGVPIGPLSPAPLCAYLLRYCYSAGQVRRASVQAVHLGRHYHHHQQQQPTSNSAATTTVMLLSASLFYVAFSLSNWQLLNDLLYFVLLFDKIIASRVACLSLPSPSVDVIPHDGVFRDYIPDQHRAFNDLLYFVPLGGYVGRTCDGLLITDEVRQRYVID